MRAYKKKIRFFLWVLFFFLALMCSEKDDEITLPVVTTLDVEDISPHSVKTGGHIKCDGSANSVIGGMIWDLSAHPDLINNDGISINTKTTGSYECVINDLLPDNIYFIRAYAMNDAGVSYGEELKFNTLNTPCKVITYPAKNITFTSAVSGGKITEDLKTVLTERGVVWDTLSQPSLERNSGFTKDGKGLGEFESHLTELVPQKEYFVRAYANNPTSVQYGNEVQFLTPGEAPLVTTKPATEITHHSAQSGGTVTRVNGSNLLSLGMVWGTNPFPTIENDTVISLENNETYDFQVTISDLPSKSKIYIRAFATSDTGTGYGQLETFWTLSDPEDEFPDFTNLK